MKARVREEEFKSGDKELSDEYLLEARRLLEEADSALVDAYKAYPNFPRRAQVYNMRNLIGTALKYIEKVVGGSTDAWPK